MTVNRTTLLDLPLPVTGTESGTWGDTTNNGLSQYMDIAIAGMNSLTSANFTAGALTLANTLGDSSATNIAAGSAQYATIRVSSLAVNSTITAPGSNRSYRIINADATYSLTIKASGQTGVTFLPGQTGVVAFNGTDYVIVGVVGAGTATDNAIVRFDGTTGKLVQNSVVTIADSTGDISGVGTLNATTLDATNIEVTNIKAKDGTAAATIADSTGVVSITANPVLSGGTANGVLYLNGSKVATSGSALSFDGTNLATTGTSTGLRLVASSTDASGSVLQVDTTATAFGRVGGSTTMGYVAGTQSIWTIGGSEQMRLTSTGLGIGTSSPGQKLEVAGNILINTSGNPYMEIKTSGAGNNPYLRLTASSTYWDVAGIFSDSADPLQFAYGGSEKARITSGGKFLIGTASSVGTLTVDAVDAIITGNSSTYAITCGNDVADGLAFGSDASYAYIQSFGSKSIVINKEGNEVLVAGTTDNGAYNLQCNGTGVWGAGAYVNGSDERLKDNIQTLNDGLAVVSQLRPVTFQYKPEHSKDQSVQPGFIAQELQQAMAGKNYVDGVVQSGPEYLNVAYQNLIPILTKAIQEQQALIESLTTRVSQLEGA